ncbi:MAG: ammonium transporter, partial [Caulobacter sp.]|nr:ammonium transporter [Caulobacter sp.]
MRLHFKPLAGLLLAATLAGAPLGAVAFAQDTAPAAAAPAAAPAPAATPAAAPAPAAAAPAAIVDKMDKGDNAWMLVSTVLVLLMILPGLALFYGGLVRSKNMLSVMMQVSTVAI